MTIQNFEKELQEKFSPDLSIRPNNPPKRVVDIYPDTVKLASVTYQGIEVCTIPNDEIFDEKNGNYGVDLRQDGRFVAHRTRPEALSIIKDKLDRLKNDKDYADSFFGRGKYSEAELRRTEIKGETTLVDTVEGELKPIEGK